MKAATHYGHCQACDRLQKLPDGMLAKHGYQIVDRGQYGYFAGVCKGAGHAPYEEDCTWIKNYLIPEAKKEDARLVAFVAELRQPATEPRAYHQMYSMGYYFGKVDILGLPEYERPMLREPKSGIMDREERIVMAERYTWLPGIGVATPENCLRLAGAMNEYYAKAIEAGELRRIRRYIDWQTKRVTDWKLRTLPPVDLAKALKKQSEKEFTSREASFIAA